MAADPDLSKKATTKAVFDEVLQHPLTLGPSALGILSGTAAILFNLGTFGYITGLAGLGLGVGAFCYNYFLRQDIFAARYLSRAHALLAQRRQEALKAIGDEMKGLTHIPEAEAFASQGSEQFALVQKKFAALAGLLSHKFRPEELAFGRYLGTAEQVYLAVLDNLYQAALSIKSIDAIDGAYIEKRLGALNADGRIEATEEKEHATLLQRKDLKEDQLKKVARLLSHNEEAMTILDKTLAAIAAIDTGQRMAQSGIEEVMGELTELASRAQKYDQNR